MFFLKSMICFQYFFCSVVAFVCKMYQIMKTSVMRMKKRLKKF